MFLLARKMLLNHSLFSLPVCAFFLHDAWISYVTGPATLTIYGAGSDCSKCFAVCVPTGVKLMCCFGWLIHSCKLRYKTFT
jgi:hypothetical protein